MKRLLIDVSSVLWSCLFAGTDSENGKRVQVGELGIKTVQVNSAAWGYENAVNHLLGVMDNLKVVPRDCIFVVEGRGSKLFRQNFYPGYKTGRDKVAEQYEEFNKAKGLLVDAFLKLGAQAVSQDGLESDDVLGYLAKNLEGERWICSYDKDLAQVVGGDIHHIRNGKIDENPFGNFPHRFIPVYISLVGDTSDGIKGARGFGAKAAERLIEEFGVQGLENLEILIKEKRLLDLQEDVAEMPTLQKIIDDQDSVYLSYALAKLWTERVNTLSRPLEWRVGMVKPKAEIKDERLRKWGGVTKLVCAQNYAAAFAWAKAEIAKSEYVTLDVETSTPEESDEWLERKGKADKVDVLGSKLTSLQLNFGINNQYTIYLPVDNVEEENVGNLTVQQVAAAVDLVPRDKITYVHNFGGFEAVVCYQAWGELWKDDHDYHGFLRNVRDTAIGCSYVNENRSKGLKSQAKELIGYDQTTYEEVTTRILTKGAWQANPVGKIIETLVHDPEDGSVPQTFYRVQYKMNQLRAREVLKYGADDCIVTAALANHNRVIMEIEHTWSVYEDVETLPAYVTALAHIQGVDFSLESMAAQEKEDNEAYDKAWAVLRQHLIDIGFTGTRCPRMSDPSDDSIGDLEFNAKGIKEAFAIISGGDTLDTQVRTPSKLAVLITNYADDVEDEDLKLKIDVLGECVSKGYIQGINSLLKETFTGEPQLDLNSPKQVKHLLYGHMDLPIHIVNDATATEKEKKPELAAAVQKFKKIRNGSLNTELSESERELLKQKAKADDTAVEFALAFDGDKVDEKAAAALRALGAMKRVLTRRQLFYNNYWNALHWKDGKLHPSVNQAGAVTRRYTVSDTNANQLPKLGEGVKFRANIKPHHKEAVVCSADFKGQELRLAAEDSQDANLLACYVGDNLKDPHNITASGAMKLKWGAAVVAELSQRFGQTDDYTLFKAVYELGEDTEEGKRADDLRKNSKNVNFASIYGAQPVKLSETLVMPLSDATLFLEARNQMFPGLIEAAERAEERAKRLGYSETFMGARRHLQSGVNSNDGWEAARAARQAFNFRIQGSAAEQVKKALARLWKSGLLFDYDVRFYFPVHDELVWSVHKDHCVHSMKVIHDAMVAQYADMKVPVLSSLSLGRDYANQIEVGDWFVEEKVLAGLERAFKE